MIDGKLGTENISMNATYIKLVIFLFRFGNFWFISWSYRVTNFPYVVNIMVKFVYQFDVINVRKKG